jgi:hypothetical protein
MKNPKLHWKLIFAGGPLIPAFAKKPPRRGANAGIGPPVTGTVCPEAKFSSARKQAGKKKLDE